jgi:hypothetical protein
MQANKQLSTKESRSRNLIQSMGKHIVQCLGSLGDCNPTYTALLLQPMKTNRNTFFYPVLCAVNAAHLFDRCSKDHKASVKWLVILL